MVRYQHATLRGYALRLCRTATDADDLVQDTLERAYVAFADFKEDASFKGWLMVIMRNLFLDQYRRSVRRRNDGDGKLGGIPAAPPDLPETWRTVEPDDLELALTELDEEFRLAFVLRWRDRRSYRQIAEELRIPLNTVGTRLWRARRALRARLSALSPQTR